MPLISVIIPVYNGGKTIQETIESVLNQTLSNIELIVINDGSQDNTLEIVASIQDSRIKVFSYPNAGVNASRNRGVSQASGDFIAFLDADDLWTPDKLETQLRALQENDQAAVAYSWVDYIDGSNRFLHPGVHVTATGDVFKELLVLNFLENGSNPLIRRQALAQVGDFEESLTHAEDWDMWLRLAAQYHFTAVPSPQVLYRVSTHSTSADVLKLEAGCLQVLERALNQVPESLHYLKKYSKARFYKGLSCKALVSGSPGSGRGITAARFLWHSIRNDPSTLQQVPFMLIMLFKIVATVLLPPRQTQALLTNIKSVSTRKK